MAAPSPPRPLLWLLALLALAAATAALAQLASEFSDGMQAKPDETALPPAPLSAAFLLLAALLLARFPAAFGYSSGLAAGVFVSVALATAVLADGAASGVAAAWAGGAEDDAGGAVSASAPLPGWARGVVMGLGAAVAVVFSLKRWAWLTGLRRFGRLGGGGKGGPEPRRLTLRVLSWNVYLRSVAREEILDDDAKSVRAARLADPALSPLRDADLVCMQEFVATANYRLHRLLDAAPAMGFRAAVTPAPPRLLSPAIADSGLVVLSRLPVDRVRGRELRGAVGPDRLMAKGVDAVRIPLGPGRPPLHLVHAHLQSGYTREDAPPVEAAKLAQLRQVAAAWDEGRAAGGPRLLCGDLNWDAREPGRHETLMAALRVKPEADLLLPRGELPSARPATIRVTYEDGPAGRELDVNYYDRPVPRGASRLDRSVDYIVADPQPFETTARAVQFPPPRGAPAMSDHLAVRADVDLGRG